MKKLFVSALMLMLATTYGQQREKGTFELTPILGAGVANYYGEDVTSKNKSITRATYGIEFDYYTSQRWSLRSGFIFQNAGTQVNSVGINAEDNLQYLIVPVNANWHFGSNRNWHLNFGLNFGYLSSAESTVNGITRDVSNVVNNIQIGLNVGIGYKFMINEKFGLSLNYDKTIGVTDVPKPALNTSFKNSVSAFYLGGVFKLN